MKIKRILAIVAVIILVALYIATLLAAIFESDYSDGLFKASLITTIIVPILIYGMQLAGKMFKDKK